MFDYTETERKYAQKFAPHERIDNLDDFSVAIDYEYKLDSEVVINETLKYHEEIIKIEDISKYVNSDNIFNVILDKIDSENKYKFTINFSEELDHFDFQAFIKTTDGKLFPFYGIYHYELKRGNYTTLSYEELASNIKIDEIYYKSGNMYCKSEKYGNLYLIQLFSARKKQTFDHMMHCDYSIIEALKKEE